MKKLRLKVFLTIFLILTAFILGVLFINNFQKYQMKKYNIENVLEQLAKSMGKKPPLNYNNGLIDNEFRNRVFLDSNIYTILLNGRGKYIEIINHTEEEIDENEFEKIIRKIINKNDKSNHIGNLYFEKYAYSFKDVNTLIIMDNSSINTELRQSLFISIIIFILLQIIIFTISYFLTEWIIKPVIASFDKQKQFVEDASHELKTPLSIILTSTDAFYNNGEIKWIDNIKNETDRMTKLVTDLLDLTKSEKSNKTIYSDVNISKLIESSVLTFESIFYEHSIKLNHEITDSIVFKCNEEQIKQLLYILLDNAINHSDDKGHIIVNFTKNKSELILEVKNKGIPIKKEDEEKIFERFYRSDESRNRSENRYGLGLAIAKNIVNNHNGIIKAFSINGYTTFKVIWNQNKI